MGRPLTLLLLLLLSLLFFFPTLSFGSHGMITTESNHSVDTTSRKLEAVLKEKGMTIFARIDHAEGAAGIGENLRPTVLIIFGNPKVGTALMKCGQTTGIDLPLKILIWEDERGRVKLTYNDPQFIADRHGITSCGQVIGKMTGALKAFTQKAAGE